jgi:hypothetical protein
MNRALPPRDRGNRSRTACGESRHPGTLSGAVGLVSRVEDSSKRTHTTKEFNDAHRELEASLRTILRCNGENELTRLLLDLCEADQLEVYESPEFGGIRWWKPAQHCELASRVFAIENEIRADMAQLFFRGFLVFSVEAGTPLDVRWISARGVRVN